MNRLVPQKLDRFRASARVPLRGIKMIGKKLKDYGKDLRRT